MIESLPSVSSLSFDQTTFIGLPPCESLHVIVSSSPANRPVPDNEITIFIHRFHPSFSSNVVVDEDGMMMLQIDADCFDWLTCCLIIPERGLIENRVPKK